MKLKNVVRSWVTTLVSIVLFGIITYKVYFMFETLTMAQAFIVFIMYAMAGGLMFASDKMFRGAFDKLLNKAAK